jgi:hypothetical protein
MEGYFNEAFPSSMENHFGRCYLEDDRVLQDRLAVRIKAFRSFLRDNGIGSKVPFHLPHRLAAARAGLGTFGKNCLLYSRKMSHKGSWALPIAVVIDRDFTYEPDTRVQCSLDNEFMSLSIPDSKETFQFNGERMTPGISVSNSEVGLTSLSIAAFMLRLVCTNGMISKTEVSASYRHVSTKILSELPAESSFRLQKVGGMIMAMVK